VLIRRFFLFLFVLLQCVAPLLHAHASGTVHGGIHMPETLGMSPSGQVVEMAAEHQQLAITMASSLQPRDEPTLATPLFLAFRLSGIAATSAPPWTPAITPRVASRLSSRLIPLSGAPPSA